MTREELIDKVASQIPSLKTSDARQAEETINSLINQLMQLKDYENQEQEDYWQEKSLEQLAKEQGVAPVKRLEDILGKSGDFFDDEEDFQAFLRATKGLDPEGTNA